MWATQLIASLRPPGRTGSSVVQVASAQARIGCHTGDADVDVLTGFTEVHVHVKWMAPILGAIGVRQCDVLLSAVLRQQDTRALARFHGVHM